MTFFFFGTLRDPEVLALVLDRRLAEGDRVAASLPDHRAVRAAAAPYPVLVRARGGAVDGAALLRPSRRDEQRITWFEEDEFEARWRFVWTGESWLRARVFFALEPLRPSAIPWDYASWQDHEKPDYIARCVEWLREIDSA